MSVYDQQNSLFHRFVNKNNQPLSIREVYNSPFPTLLYDKDTPENPLQGAGLPEDKITYVYFGTYSSEPIQWRILGYDSASNGIVLLSEYILEKRKFDSSTNVWHNCDLRKYLNSSNPYTENGFYNTCFTEEEKGYIKDVITGTYNDSIDSDRVFLLSGNIGDKFEDLLYPSLNTYTKRKAKYGEIITAWWLRSPGSGTGVDYVSTIGSLEDNYSPAYTGAGVRPVIVVSLDVIKNNKSIINPFYCSTVWSKETFPNRTFGADSTKDRFSLTISDPISTHNQKYQGHNRDIYSNIREDFALFTKEQQTDVIVTYYYIFKNEKIQKTISMDDLPEGIYITPRCVVIKENGKLYQSGFTNKQTTFEQLFFSKFEEMENPYSFPSKAVYASCWADLDPRLELYLPVSDAISSRKESGSTLDYYWLGEIFKEMFVEEEIYNILKDLHVKYEGPFI